MEIERIQDLEALIEAQARGEVLQGVQVEAAHAEEMRLDRRVSKGGFRGGITTG